MGESVLEATVAHWFKREGELIAIGEALVELETDKANTDIEATSDGVLARIERQEGEDVHVGDVLGIIEPAKQEEQAEQPEAESEGKVVERAAEPEAEEAREKDSAAKAAAQAPAAEQDEEPSRRITPVAKQMMAEYNLKPEQITPQKPDGRIRRADLERYLQEQKAAPREEPQNSSLEEQPPIGEKARPMTRQRMSRRRRTIASRLVEAQHTTATLTTFNDVVMQAVVDLRKRHNPEFSERYGVRLGITSFFVKAAISALKAYPRLNAEIEGDDMLIKNYYDIGVAIGDEGGLVVPVLRDADRLSFAEIEKKIANFSQQAAEGRLSLDDLRGGTFTISNGGVFGSLLSTPILNPPQVGVLGLHRIEKRPVVIGDDLVIRPVMYVALSYDHRIIDGREAVQFLAHIKKMIEDPGRLLIEG